MTAQQLKNIQESVKFDITSFALCIGVPYRTLQNYLLEVSPIPDTVARAALELQHIERELDRQRIEDYDRKLAKKYPQGIGEKIVLQPEPISRGAHA